MLELKISGGDGVHVKEFDCKGHQLHAILSMSSLVTWPQNRQGPFDKARTIALTRYTKYKYGIDGIEGQAVGGRGRLHNNFTMTTCRQSFFKYNY